MSTARYYTRGASFPKLVGRFADGTPIPFGPFRVSLVIAAVTGFVLANVTRPLWGSTDLVRDYALLVAAAAVGVLVAKLVRFGRRDPLTSAVALTSVLAQPRLGRLDGRRVRLARPLRATTVTVWTDDPAPEPLSPLVGLEATPRPTAVLVPLAAAARAGDGPGGSRVAAVAVGEGPAGRVVSLSGHVPSNVADRRGPHPQSNLAQLRHLQLVHDQLEEPA